MAYVCSTEIRPLDKMMRNFIMQNGYDYVQVFDDFLKFIIGNFNPDLKPDPTWRYTKEQNKVFHEMMCTYFQIMDDVLKKQMWCDAFGDLFMSVVGNNSQQYRGQFFTPDHICNFMAEVSLVGQDMDKEPEVYCGGFGKRLTVNDPTCGSGRLLMAAHSVFLKNGKRPAYFIGEDIDAICAKMTAVNMMMHGMFGEVVCHNSLAEPDKVTVGYIVNEMMYPFPGLPSVRVFHEPERFIACRRWMVREKPEPQPVKEQLTVEPPKKRTQTIQLELF